MTADIVDGVYKVTLDVADMQKWHEKSAYERRLKYKAEWDRAATIFGCRGVQVYFPGFRSACMEWSLEEGR